MLRLVKLKPEYKQQLFDMMEEYDSDNLNIPRSIRKHDYHDFNNYLATLETTLATDTLVPDSTFFCLDTSQNKFVGVVNIRHYLNDALLLNGGHIGDSVLPSERQKGVATAMISMALKECKKLSIPRVLMVCDKNNIGSAKSIQHNGGVLENEILVDGIVEQRYWIDL